MEDDEKNKKVPAAPESSRAEVIEALKKFANEDDTDKSNDVSLRSVLGGDVLQSKFMMKQIGFVMFLAILMIVYTGNRYASQQDAIVINGMKEELQTMRYNVLTVSSELTNLTRQSVIEKQLKSMNDTSLLNSTIPPFAIMPEE